MQISARHLVTAIAAATLISACSNPEQTKRKHFETAQALAAQNKDQDAILELRNALKIDAKYAEAREKLSEEYFKVGNIQQGGKELIRAAQLLPARADLQVKAAALHIAARDFDGARRFAKAAVAADPKNVDAQIVLANAMAGLKDTNGAVRELEQAMQLAPDDSRTYTSLGTIKAAAGNAEEAEAAFRKAVEIDPKSLNARLALGYYLWSRGNVTETEQALRAALDIDRDNLPGNRLLAYFYLSQGRTADAESPLLRLVNKKDVPSTLILGDLYTRTGRAPQARTLFQALADQKQTHAIGVARLAVLDYGANKRDEAHKAVDAALTEDPNNTELLVVKSKWLLVEHKTDEALQIADKAATGAAQSPEAQLQLGLVHEARGERAEALKSYNDAIKLNPNLMQAQLGAARLALAGGDLDAALQHVGDARRIDPRSGDAAVIAVRVSLAKRDVAGAEREASGLVAGSPQSALAHSLAGQVLLLKNDSVNAAKEFDKALAINPSDADALAGRLTVDVQQKQPADARGRVARALARDDKNGKLLVTAARLENSLGDPAAAERYLRKAIDVDSGNLAPYSMLGMMYFQQKRLPEAQKEFEQIVQRRPDAIGARTMLGMLLDAQNRHDESAKVYEAVLTRTSRAPVAANNLAYIHADKGDQLDYALELAQTAKQQLPDSPEVSDTLGWVYYKKDMPELAIQAFEMSAKRDPKNAGYQYHLGMAYAKVGQYSKARRALEAALTLQPNFDGADEARKKLSELKG